MTAGDGAAAPGKPLPRITPLDAPHWEATTRGVLLVQRCADCARWQWPAATRCPGCGADALVWEPASGRGTVHTYTVVHAAGHPAFADEVPYNVTVVQLDEGPLMLTNVVGLANADLAVDLAVEVTFEPVNAEMAIPRFTPLAG
ncbi:MAG TPA: OB-fold domain-containing protein [Pseudonocardia sp.]|nr:OB-fold domain-containing protein [Pseudonocardia sp.]